jgi:hypothetical protein
LTGGKSMTTSTVPPAVLTSTLTRHLSEYNPGNLAFAW